MLNSEIRGWLLRLLAAVLVAVSLASASSADTGEPPVLDVSNIEDSTSIGEYVLLLRQGEDDVRRLTDRQLDYFLEEIEPGAASAKDWVPNDAPEIRLNTDEQYVWVSLSLTNQGSNPVDVLLELQNTPVVAWFYRKPDGDLTYHIDDFELNRAGRSVFHRAPVVPLRLEPKDSLRLFVGHFGQPGQVIRDRLWQPEEFREYQARHMLVDGTYFGLVLALVVYNLIAFFTLRQMSYLLFAGFVSASAFTVYLGSGLGTAYLFADHLIYVVPALFVGAGFIDLFSALFSIALLRIKETNTRLFFLWAGVITVNLTNSTMVSYLAVSDLTDINANFIVTTSIVATAFEQLVLFYTLYFYWARSVIARYWFLAMMLHTWMFIVWSAVSTSLENAHYLVQAVTLIDMIVFSVLLTYNYRSEQKGREVAQRANLETLRYARDLEQAKSNFVATVGHDLHGPVRAISFFADSLRESQAGRSAEAIDKIDENIRTITELLDSLVKLSQIESQSSNPTLEITPLSQMLYSLKSEFEVRASDVGIDLEFATTDVHVLTDRVCLSQILRNLIENALKHTTHGSIRVDVVSQNDQVCVSVEDTGIGIPPDDLKRVFDEFYQVDSAQQSGVGLGLSIVARLTKLLDIEVTIESEPGHGTRVALTLASAEPEMQSKAQANTGSDDLPIQVLSLGNSAGVQRLNGLLEEWGADVVALRQWRLNDVIEQSSDADLMLADADAYDDLAPGVKELTINWIVLGEVLTESDEQVQICRSDISALKFRHMVQRYVLWNQ